MSTENNNISQTSSNTDEDTPTASGVQQKSKFPAEDGPSLAAQQIEIKNKKILALKLEDLPHNNTSSPDEDTPTSVNHILSTPNSQSAGIKRALTDFEIGETLGEGAFAQVVKATEITTRREFAIKMLERKHIIKEKKEKYVKTEKEILSILHHPNIVKLYYTFKDQEYLYFVLELCGGGELQKRIRKLGSLSLGCARFYAAEVISGIEHMHSKGVIHRDLKPENVLLTKEMHVKLTDFGTAKVIGNDPNARSGSFCGTAEYVSPELLTDKEVGKSADLWALGCIIYQFITGRPPFKAVNEYQTFQKIIKQEYIYPTGFPDIVKDLCKKLLNPDPNKRLGANGFQELKSHQFFDGINWETLYEQEPPKLEPNSVKMVFEDDDSHRAELLAEQKRNSVWANFLSPNELIIESGLVSKRKGISVKKRQLILTDYPRLIYIDPDKMVQKGEIEWSENIRPEIKSNKNFLIHTPNRVYILEDIACNAQRWIDAINKQLQKERKKTNEF